VFAGVEAAGRVGNRKCVATEIISDREIFAQHSDFCVVKLRKSGEIGSPWNIEAKPGAYRQIGADFRQILDVLFGEGTRACSLRST
jgi:hypothetical protein